jgi:DNA topoisomerase-2
MARTKQTASSPKKVVKNIKNDESEEDTKLVKKVVKKVIKKTKDEDNIEDDIKDKDVKVVKKTVKKSTGKCLNTIEHMLKRPDMYIRSVRIEKKDIFVFNEEKKKILRKNIEYNEGLARIFIEIYANALDNKIRSDESEYPMTYLQITVDENGLTTIKNDGLWIPVKKEEYEFRDEITSKITKKVLYPAELLFGYMRSGTNYDDNEKRKTSGRNGIGCKATNVYSKIFKVTCVDPENKLKFEQTFEDNLSKRGEPIVTKANVKKGYTEVSFLPDFKKFGYENYTEDFKSLLKKFAYDCTMMGLNVTFNGEKVTIKTLTAYAKLYFEEEFNYMVLQSKDCQVILAEHSKENAIEYGFTSLSFVNGIYTREGGIHVNKWADKLLKQLVKDINARKPKKNESPIKVSKKDIEKYFVLFVNASLEDPEFNSQTKDMCISPEPDVCKLEDKEIKKILKWNFLKYIEESMMSKMETKLATTVKRGRLALGSKADDANKAGSKESHLCIGIFTEGDSAKLFADTGRAAIGNQDYMGTFALKGKIINASKYSIKKVSDNNEIRQMMEFLGLSYGVDYSKKENRNDLRYGKVYILTDADPDGFHIAGLFLNFFYNNKNFRELIKHGFIELILTPIIKVMYKKKEYKFYFMKEFMEWKNKNNFTPSKTNTKYYKGLGTHDPESAGSEFENLRKIKFKLDGNEDKYMIMGFDEKNANERKDWILKYDPQKEEMIIADDELAAYEMTLSTFIDEKLILYHYEAVMRTMPSLYDGLKQGQRKILAACFKRNLTKGDIKVAQLAGYVSEHMGYHHGEESLNKTITKMAQGFVGANNIPLLVNKGQFGSRLQKKGKDANGKKVGGTNGGAAAPRYIFTRLEDVTSKIFRSEDYDLLEKNNDDYDEVEPVYFMPIIPMLLVNGTDTIACGWSSKIPKYNPIDLVNWIKCWLNKEDLPEIIPWWRNFKGDVSIENKKVITTGIIEDNGNIYQVSELPIGMWTMNFKEKLEKLMKEKSIRSFDAYNTPNTVNFYIYPSRGNTIDVAGELNLKTTISMTNMHALNEFQKPQKFNDVNDILLKFCEMRFEYYTLRKDNMLKKLKHQLLICENKYRFITDYINEDIIINKRDEEDLFNELEDKGFAKVEEKYNYLVDMPIRTLTKQKLEVLKKDIDNIKSKIKTLKNKSEKDLWIEDLDEFEVEYEKFLKNRKDDVQPKKKAKKVVKKTK